MFYILLFPLPVGFKKTFILIEASRGAGAQNVTVKPTGCGFDPHSRR